jgi:hypothetical protein
MSTCTYNLTIANGLLPAINTALIAKRAKNVALFFLSPFIGLAYLIALPFVGFGMLAWVAAKAVMKSKTARPIAMVMAAPVVALVFVTVGPIVALLALAAMGAKAALNV